MGCSISVTGAVADRTYNGEGYVVGPVLGSGSNKTYTSLTLGNTDGANMPAAGGTTNMPSAPSGSTTDTFLANTKDNSSQVSTQITLQFTGLSIASASFDYEIFPDGTGQPPDFQFKANNTLVSSFGTGGIQYGVTPSTANTVYYQFAE